MIFTFVGQAGNESVKMFYESLFFRTYWTVKTQEILFVWIKLSQKPRNQILSLGTWAYLLLLTMAVNMMLRETQDETAINHNCFFRALWKWETCEVL